METFNTNDFNAKVHGLSIQAGEVFRDLYHSRKATSAEIDTALDAYRALRRLLPLTDDGKRHVGHRAAWYSTQTG